MIATSVDTVARRAPSFMMARLASMSAVSGSARMKGCMTSGERVLAKNTPHSIIIGMVVRLMSPDTVSVVVAKILSHLGLRQREPPRRGHVVVESADRSPRPALSCTDHPVGAEG